MMSCEQFTRELSDYLDGQVELPQRARMWLHAAVCSHCRRYTKQMRLVVRTAHELRTPNEGPDAEQMASLLQAFANPQQHEG